MWSWHCQCGPDTARLIMILCLIKFERRVFWQVFVLMSDVSAEDLDGLGLDEAEGLQLD